MGSGLAGFSYPNVNFEPGNGLPGGVPGDYMALMNVGKTNLVFDGYKRGSWSLSNICTHLGCIPNEGFLPNEFKCPCHGSGYYMNGINFEGPAPRPLERYKIGINAEGLIKVDKTKLYRYEMGQWDHPDSFIPI